MEPVMHTRRALSLKSVLLIICLKSVHAHNNEREWGSDKDLEPNVRIERRRRESRCCNEPQNEMDRNEYTALNIYTS